MRCERGRVIWAHLPGWPSQVPLPALQYIPSRPLHGPPDGRLPGAAAQDGMREAGDIERGAPVTVTVLAQVEIVAGAVQSDRQQADAVPVVEPTVDERQLGRFGLDQHGGKRSPG